MFPMLCRCVPLLLLVVDWLIAQLSRPRLLVHVLHAHACIVRLTRLAIAVTWRQKPKLQLVTNVVSAAEMVDS